MPLQQQQGKYADKLRAARVALEGVNVDLDAILRDQAIESAVAKHLEAFGEEAKAAGQALLKEVGPKIGKALVDSALEKIKGD
jgi:putative heme iron utilization protein